MHQSVKIDEEKHLQRSARFKNREKTGHLPLNIVEQGGLNPDYDRGKMLCVRVCVYVSVACRQCVLSSIVKQQVS